MTRIKLLTVVLAALALTALPAAPAGAWFKSRNQTKTTGLVKVGKTSLTFKSVKFACESAEGEWSIQTKGQFKDHEKMGKQVKTTLGPDLFVKIGEWHHCVADFGLAMDGTLSGEECLLQFQQEQKSTGPATALVSIVSGCMFVSHAIQCPVFIVPGNEQTGVDAFLKGVKSEQGAQNVLATAKVEGIHTTDCQEGTNAIFESEEGGIKAEGLELA